MSYPYVWQKNDQVVDVLATIQLKGLLDIKPLVPFAGSGLRHIAVDIAEGIMANAFVLFLNKEQRWICE